MSKPLSPLVFACFLLSADPSSGSDACPGILAQQLGDSTMACQLLSQERLVSVRGNSDVVFRLFRWTSSLDEPPSPLYDTPPYNQVGVTLSLAVNPPAEAFWAKHQWLGEGWFEAPYMVRNERYGEILVVSERYSGTGSMIDDHLLMPTMAHGWQAIDASRDWVARLVPYIPEGYGIVKGILVDYATFTGETAVWRPDDANCCPSGGRIWFKLELRGPNLSLLLVEARYSPPGEN